MPTGDITLRASVALAGGSKVIVDYPKVIPGSITIIAGDDYKHVDGRSVRIGDSQQRWPDLDGAVVVLHMHKRPNDRATFNGQVLAGLPDGITQVAIDIIGATTDSMTRGDYDYSVEAELASGSNVTLDRGRLKLV